MARYIDAEALMETIKTHDYLLATRNNSTDYGMFTLGIQEAVDIQSTADVAPVVHAHWVIHTDKFSPMQRCTNCNFEIPIVATETESEMYLYSYCPACGARMDEKG